MKKYSIAVLVFVIIIVSSPALVCAGKWKGVDESVVEKIASEHGREARKPYINTDQGDLLLFAFLLAGAAGGFIAGYSLRALLEKGSTAEKSALTGEG